jgi:hypothetical protein
MLLGQTYPFSAYPATSGADGQEGKEENVFESSSATMDMDWGSVEVSSRGVDAIVNYFLTALSLALTFSSLSMP